MSTAILYIHLPIPGDELISGLQKILPLSCKRQMYLPALYCQEFSLQLFRNKDGAEPNENISFPNGYFHFSHYLEFDVEEGVEERQAVEWLIRITEFLWEKKIPCVVESDWDDLLPLAGGYNHSDLPWPNKNK